MAITDKSQTHRKLFESIKTLIYEARKTVARNINITMVMTNSPSGQKSETLSRISPFQLSWSHYVFLMRLSEAERKFYEIEAVKQNWSLRELERQFNSSLYERLALSRDKHRVKELSQKGHILTTPQDAIKEPYVLEFLGLKEETGYMESDMEFTLPKNNKQIFARKYQLYLPSKEELRRQLEE